jgi:hypothetical protein
MKSKIRIVAALPQPKPEAQPKPKFECYGCRCQTEDPCHYAEDSETHWCKDCFVTEEMIDECRKKMPIWQDLLKPKPKIKVVEKLPTVKKTKIKIVKTLPTD